jgi:hypothetical protein
MVIRERFMIVTPVGGRRGEEHMASRRARSPVVRRVPGRCARARVAAETHRSVLGSITTRQIDRVCEVLNKVLEKRLMTKKDRF